VSFERTLMMRFVGQGSETALAIERKPFQKWSQAAIRRRFDDAYQKLYGRTYPENAVEFVTFKVRASLPQRPFRLPPLERRKGRIGECIKGRRPAFSVLQRKCVPFTVYDRLKFFPGARMPGPAIIEEKESTIVVGEDARARVDEFGFVWIDMK
jgi:N-methylhydantoinase A